MNMPFNPALFDANVLNLSAAERLARTLCVSDIKVSGDTVTAVIEFDSRYKIDVKANLSDDHGEPYVNCVKGYVSMYRDDNINLLDVELGSEVTGIALAIERKLAVDFAGRSVSAEEAFGGAL